MSRLRFATARSLFETFPELGVESSMTPNDDPPVVFLNNLTAHGKYEDAVQFCAHLLPRREAVWWACRSVRALLGNVLPARSAALLAAETWVQEPSDENRLAALKIGEESDDSDPLTWLAFSAGWAGGMLSSQPELPVPVPPYMTARAVRIAILLSAQEDVESSERQMRACIAEGIALAQTGL